MASIYTDESREIRYIKLRRYKRIINRVLDVCMVAVLLTTLLSITDIGSPLMQGLGKADITGIFRGIFGLLATAGLIIAIYAKNWRIAAGEMAMLFLAQAGGAISDAYFFCIIDAIVLGADICWYRLSQQEGFPLFEIGYSEEQEKQKALERYAENRAVEAGSRIVRSAPDNEMHDLLDAEHDIPTLTHKLDGKHELSRLAQPYENPREAFTPGVMSALEEPADKAEETL